MLAQTSLLRIGRLSAAYDLVVTLPFATPWTYALLIELFNHLQTIAWPDASPIAIEPHQMLFANLMGSVVVVWSIVRLRLMMVELVRWDAVARFLFTAWQVHALTSGATPLLVPFIVIELLFGIAQSLPLKRRVADRI